MLHKHEVAKQTGISGEAGAGGQWEGRRKSQHRQKCTEKTREASSRYETGEKGVTGLEVRGRYRRDESIGRQRVRQTISEICE